jgi:hypothetical protein
MLHGNNRISQVLALSEKSQIAKIRHQKKIKISTATLIKVIAFAEVFVGQWHHFKPTKNYPTGLGFFFGDTNLVSIQKISEVFL